MCGKSTQINLAAKELSNQGYEVHVLQDPGYSTVGKAVRAIIMDKSIPRDKLTDAYLFAASRAQLVIEINKILSLNPNAIILCDRFILSSLIYQKDDSFDVLSINREITNIFSDYKYIVFDISLEEYKKRKNEKLILDNMDEYADKRVDSILEGYREYAKNNNSVYLIDSSGFISDTHKNVMNYINKNIFKR